MEALITVGASRGLGAQILAKAIGHYSLRIGLARSGTYEDLAERALTAKIKVDIANHPELEATIGSLFLGLRGMVGLRGITLVFCAGDCLPGVINSIRSNADYQRSLQVNFISPLIFTRSMLGFAKRAGINLDIASFTHRADELSLRRIELYSSSKAALANGLAALCDQYANMRVQNFELPLMDTQFFDQANLDNNFTKDFVESLQNKRDKKELVNPAIIASQVVEVMKNPLNMGFSTRVL